MSVSKHLLFSLLVCHSWLANAYLFDTTSPIIIRSNLTDTSSLFGFSMDYFKPINGTAMLLVGAPGLDINGTKEGGVFVCPIEKDSVCKFAPAFSNRFSTPLLSLLMTDERMDGQLMGFSIRASESANRIHACAPLFIKTVTSKNGHLIATYNGRCVVLPHDFTDDTAPYQVTINQFNLAGIDAYVIDDNELKVGATHSGDSGTVYSIRGYNFFPYKHSETSTSSTFDDQRGYHLERGYFRRDKADGQFDLFSSAPRANNHKGMIEIFREESLGTLLYVIEGTEPDGYFGYDFALLDLQSNGYHTVVVGCPHCNLDIGQVTVFVHSGDYNNPIKHTQWINPPSSSQGQFGTAVENIGDIDNDGYEDVAISAPHDGGGVVYVYRGSAEGLVLKNYQVIEAEPGLVGFGYTLTGGMDVDDNGSPDLSAASLSSTNITVIRTNPLVNIDISFLEDNSSFDILHSQCTAEGILLSCFNVTPCFHATFIHREVDEFSLQYSIAVDQDLRRVSSLDDTSVNSITDQVVTFTKDRLTTCVQSYTFVLRREFSSLEPFPVVISVADSDRPSKDESDKFGAPLHPVLNKYISGSEERSNSMEGMVTAGTDLHCPLFVCEPEFDINVEVMDNIDVVPLAAGFELTLDITLTISNDDSLGTFFVVDKPSDLFLTNAESVTEFAITRCEQSLLETSIQCFLKNPIFVEEEEVNFILSFVPNAQNLDIESLTLNFSVWDSKHDEPFATSNISLMTESVASYKFESGFADDIVQVSRLPPAFNTTASSLDGVGPTVIYQTLISNGLDDQEGSPIPLTTLTITWPSILNVAGVERPLLVPNNLIVVPSDSAVCVQSGAIPRRFLSLSHQPLSLPEAPEKIDIENCTSNIECGAIQCTIMDLRAQSSKNTSAVTPVQIILFATVWSTAIKETVSINVQSKIESNTEYPEILPNSKTESMSTITLSPAVVEVFQECFPLYVIVGAVTAGLLVVLFVVLVLAMCGCFGHGYYKKKQQQEIDKQRYNRRDSLRARIIPVTGRFDHISDVKDADDDSLKRKESLPSFNDDSNTVSKLYVPGSNSSGSDQVDLHETPDDSLENTPDDSLAPDDLLAEINNALTTITSVAQDTDTES